MADDQSNATNARKLADLLLENEALSGAQVELALADQEINDIPLEEILLVRGWITEEKLYAISPWLKPGSKERAPWDQDGSGPKVVAKAPQPKVEWKPVVTDPPKPSPSSSSSHDNTNASTSSGGSSEKAAPKPTNIPKAPPQRPSGAPTVESSPVKSDHDANLKAYKEVLKRILATE